MNAQLAMREDKIDPAFFLYVYFPPFWDSACGKRYLGTVVAVRRLIQGHLVLVCFVQRMTRTPLSRGTVVEEQGTTEYQYLCYSLLKCTPTMYRCTSYQKCHVVQGRHLWRHSSREGRLHSGAVVTLLPIRPFLSWG